MSCLAKIFLAISCYIPLYLIILIRNIYAIADGYDCSLGFIYQSLKVKYNCWMGLGALILTVVGILGIVLFVKTFLGSRYRSAEEVKLDDAENITDQNFFTYFSFFVVAFMSVDPVDPEKAIDVMILLLVLTISIVVYYRNSLFFLNPFLNILGYRSYRISYRKIISEKEMSERSSLRVFSRKDLKPLVGKKVLVTYSENSFSVCRNI